MKEVPSANSTRRGTWRCLSFEIRLLDDRGLPVPGAKPPNFPSVSAMPRDCTHTYGVRIPGEKIGAATASECAAS